MIPSEITESLKQFRQEYPDPVRVAFIMMEFGNTDAHQKIADAIKRTLNAHGLIGIRADDKTFHDDVWYNVLTYMHGCGFGVAVFERLESDAFNPNVSLEVGHMFGLGKRVCLLKDKTLKALHTDLMGKLYKPFDPQHASRTIGAALAKWLADRLPPSPSEHTAPEHPEGSIVGREQASPAKPTDRIEVQFSLMESVEWQGGMRIAIGITDSGETELHIRQVVLLFTARYDADHTMPVRAVLTPLPRDAADGLIVPKKPINAHDHPPPWQRHYILHGAVPAHAREMMRLAAGADPATLRMEVWATERPDKPVWSADGADLDGLRSLVTRHWDAVVKNHPAYPQIRKLLRLSDSVSFVSWPELVAEAAKVGFKDTTKDDESAYWLSNLRGGRHIRIDRSLFDSEGGLLPMLPEEWQTDLVRLKVKKVPRPIQSRRDGVPLADGANAR